MYLRSGEFVNKKCRWTNDTTKAHDAMEKIGKRIARRMAEFGKLIVLWSQSLYAGITFCEDAPVSF